MLTQSITDALNEQIKKEAKASHMYLAMASWCDQQGLAGCAKFLYAHAEEERQHMLKLFHYLIEAGSKATVPAIEQPRDKFDSLSDVFETVFQAEKEVSQSIFNLVDQSLTEKDYSTFNFLQWYVAEQHEEERLFQSILDKIKLIGTSHQGEFMIDREIGAMKT